ncbi:MAG: DJ-1/PfpI family protein [Candidatus Micrarchaeota archaeon]
MAKPKILFFIAPGGFRDEELFEPKRELESRGCECVIASTRRGVFAGKLGGKAESKLSLEAGELRATDFVAIVFVGGPGVEEHKLDSNAAVLALAREFASAGKIVAAICIAPRILAAACVVEGKRVTAFPDDETIAALKQAGAVFTGRPCETDGKIVTADGPSSARVFGQAIAKAVLEAVSRNQ